MTPPPLARCSSCQAPHAPDEAVCWMCGETFWDARGPREPKREAPAPPPASPIPPLPPEKRGSGNAATRPVLIVAFVLVLLGAATSGGAQAVLMLAGLVPALIVTALSDFPGMKRAPNAGKGGRGMVFAAGTLLGIIALAALAFWAFLVAVLAVCTGKIG
ncbi:MAG: hypothetical protein ACHQ51_09425 [Elusimicrobiota bacterium]